MYNEKLPIGEPVFFKGEYKQDKLYPLYIQRISCSFKLKKNKIPTIQIKGNLSFVPNEYLESSNGDIVSLTLTNVDLELFFEHYDVEFLIYHCGWKFKGINGLFNKYINYWSENKIQAKKDGNSSLYLIAKLMLNSLYGKFGLNPNVRGKYPYLDNGIVKYHMLDKEIRDSIYIPVASFITSYARRKTITTSQKIKEYSINKYGKDLYIDSDTLITQDLFQLFNVDIKNYYIAAIRELRAEKKGFHKLVNQIHYFNSGVMLMNLKKMRENDISAKLLIAKKNQPSNWTCMDQDVFNNICGGETLYLDCKYNNTCTIFLDSDIQIDEINGFYHTKYKSWSDFVKKSVIIHFAGPSKPWLYNIHIVSKLYFGYLKKVLYHIHTD